MVTMIRSSIQFLLLYILTIEQFYELFNDHFPIVKLELITEIGSSMMASTMMIVNSLMGTLFTRKVISILNRIDRIDLDLKRLDVEINSCSDSNRCILVDDGAAGVRDRKNNREYRIDHRLVLIRIVAFSSTMVLLVFDTEQLTRSDRKNNREYRIDHRLVLIRIVAFSSTMVLLVFDTEQLTRSFDHLEDLVRVATYIVSLTIATICISVDVIYRKKMVYIWNSLGKIAVEYEDLGVQVPYWKIWITSIVCIIFSVAYLVIAITTTDYSDDQYDCSWYRVIAKTLANVLYVVNYVIQIQYSNYALAIQTMYSVLNQYLEMMFSDRKTRTQGKFGWQICWALFTG
ncbi:hypothetical protein QE152_g40470 [Popillia japonica]|uniref:Gustatory receptor n=1 Tax=Popillia japonica TaxID=7064 RepID=A0AAW1HGA8_POPJA